MGIRDKLKKWIPKEVRNNPVLVIAAVALTGPAALGALGASSLSLVGATVAANSALAIAAGTGVLTSGITFLQTGDVSDSLKAGVLSGTGSYLGSVVSTSVSNAVSSATGAPLGTGVGATVGPGGEFLSTAGGTGFGAAGTTGFQTAAGAGSMLGVANPTFAGFLAGNVAGRSTEAAITGKPIEQAALFGAAQSIGFGLDKLPDFKSLPVPVQDVLVSSAQAAVMGQDVGDAAIEALIRSTGIVGKALQEIPGGVAFTAENPTFTKYVINSVSSALAAQLQGKDVPQTVLDSLVRTTASVLKDKFNDAQAKANVEQANAKYTEAQEKTQRAEEVANRLQTINDDPKYASSIYNINTQQNFVDSNLYPRYQLSLARYNAAVRAANNAQAAGDDAAYQEAVKSANQNASFLQEYKKAYDRARIVVLESEYSLKTTGYFTERTSLEDEYNQLESELSSLFSEIQNFASDLVADTSTFYTNIETDLVSALSPLTGFEGTDVTDQQVLDQIQEVAARPDIQGPTGGTELAEAPTSGGLKIDITTGRNIYTSPDGNTIITFNGALFVDGELVKVKLTPEEIKDISGLDVSYAPEEIANYLSEFGITKNAPVNALYVDPNGAFYVGEDLNVYDARNERVATMSPQEFQSLTGQVPTEAVTVNPDTLLRTNDGKLTQQERPTAELQIVGSGTGTVGAPAVDLGAQAPVEVVDPSFTMGFDLRDYGPGSPTSPNLAVFEIGGGRGVPGGSSSETTFNLVSRDTLTGEETYNVGGKQYSLIVLPDKQVLLPKEPSEVIVYLERDPVTNLPKMKEVPTTKVPPTDAKQIADKEIENQIVKEATQETQAPGGDTEGAEGVRGDEGVVGGLTGETASPPAQPVQPTKSEAQKVTDQILSMAVGRSPADMRYDLNKDGKITSADAVAYLRGERPILDAEIALGEFRPDTTGDVGGQVGVGTEGDTTGLPPIDEIGDVAELPGGDGGGGGGGGLGDEITDDEIIGLIQDQIGDLAGGEGEGLPRGEGDETGTDEEGEGLGGDEGEGVGTGDEGAGPGGGDEGVGPGAGGEGDGTGEGEGDGGGEGEPPLPPPRLPPPVITTVARQQPLIRPPEGAPYRVTGQDESGILGRKQPLFGGDEDLQKAEWNRRSLRLRRLLGL